MSTATMPGRVDPGGGSPTVTGGVGDFPEDLFTITGSPDTIEADASQYGSYAAGAADFSHRLRGNTADSWTGSEGDTYRTRVAEYVPMMTTAHQVFADVTKHLGAFASTMATQQKAMRSLHDHALVVWQQLRAARAAQAEATAAVGVAALAVATSNPAAAAGVAQAQTALAQAQGSLASADADVARLEAEWQDCVSKAEGIHRIMNEAATAAVGAIGGLSEPPTVPPPAAGGAEPTTIDPPVTQATPESESTSGDETDGKGEDGGPLSWISKGAGAVKDFVVDEAQSTWRGAKATGQLAKGVLEGAAGGVTYLVDKEAGRNLLDAAGGDLSEGGRKWMSGGDGLTFLTWVVPAGVAAKGVKWLAKPVINMVGRSAAKDVIASITAKGAQKLAPLADTLRYAHWNVDQMARKAGSNIVGKLGQFTVPIPIPVHLADGTIGHVAAKPFADGAAKLQDYITRRNITLEGEPAHLLPNGRTVPASQVPAGVESTPLRSSLDRFKTNLGSPPADLLRPGVQTSATVSWAPHHIVPVQDARFSLVRQKLLDAGIDLDSAHNGVWLASSDKHVGADALTTIGHNKTFSNHYAAWMHEQFADVHTKDDVLAQLQKVKAQLQKPGSAPWEK